MPCHAHFAHTHHRGTFPFLFLPSGLLLLFGGRWREGDATHMHLLSLPLDFPFGRREKFSHTFFLPFLSLLISLSPLISSLLFGRDLSPLFAWRFLLLSSPLSPLLCLFLLLPFLPPPLPACLPSFSSFHGPPLLLPALSLSSLPSPLPPPLSSLVLFLYAPAPLLCIWFLFCMALALWFFLSLCLPALSSSLACLPPLPHALLSQFSSPTHSASHFLLSTPYLSPYMHAFPSPLSLLFPSPFYPLFIQRGIGSLQFFSTSFWGVGWDLVFLFLFFPFSPLLPSLTYLTFLHAFCLLSPSTSLLPSSLPTTYSLYYGDG